MNIEQFQNVAMNVVEGVCGILARPVELMIRPWHGTRYFPVPVIFFSTMLMIFLPLISAFTTATVQMIPFVRIQAPVGLFGLGSLSKLYFLLSFVHGIRLWRRMIHMSREEYSTYEGPPLPVFQLLPKSESHWFTRMVMEPLVLLIVTTVLKRLLIVQPGLATYLQVAAFALAMKEFIAWYRAWEYLRILLDARFAGPIIAKMADNRASGDELAAVHLAGFPKDLSPDIRQSAIAHIARVFEGDK
jgi:hypothetical protein